MVKKIIHLKESELKQIISEGIKKYFKSYIKESFDPNMPVFIIGGKLDGRYTAQEVIDNFELNGKEEPFKNPEYGDSPIVGYPKIKGYIGPMWDTDKIRYESPEAYKFFSR